MRYMLETNICIHLLKQHPPQVFERLRQVLGLFKQRIPVLAFEETAAERFGVARAAVRERSRHVLDRLIAVHALSIGAILVTNNEADFAGYPGLVIENRTAGFAPARA